MESHCAFEKGLKIILFKFSSIAFLKILQGATISFVWLGSGWPSRTLNKRREANPDVISLAIKECVKHIMCFINFHGNQRACMLGLEVLIWSTEGFVAMHKTRNLGGQGKKWSCGRHSRRRCELSSGHLRKKVFHQPMKVSHSTSRRFLRKVMVRLWTTAPSRSFCKQMRQQPKKC